MDTENKCTSCVNGLGCALVTWQKMNNDYTLFL